MITAGIDCGARAAKAVILIDGAIAGKGTSLTGDDPGRAADDSLDTAMKEAGIQRKDLERIGGTGSDEAVMNVADTRVTEIDAMWRAARFFFPDARTVVDVGAEEARAVNLGRRGGIAAARRMVPGATRRHRFCGLSGAAQRRIVPGRHLGEDGEPEDAEQRDRERHGPHAGPAGALAGAGDLAPGALAPLLQPIGIHA